MTRKQQIKEALALLDPPPPEREDCRRDIERMLDRMEGVSRVVKYAVTKKSMRAYSAALRKMQTASRNHARAGGSLTLRGIDQAVASNEAWSRSWQPPPRWLKHKEAVGAAYKLLARWTRRGIVVSSTGTWHKLSAILFGDERVNLYRHLRAFAGEWRIRRRRK